MTKILRSENFISEKLNIKPMSRGELRMNNAKKNSEYIATSEQEDIVRVVYEDLYNRLQNNLNTQLNYIRIMNWDWVKSTNILMKKSKRNMTFMINDDFMEKEYDDYTAMVTYTDYGKVGHPYIFAQIPIYYAIDQLFEKLGANMDLCEEDTAYVYLDNDFDKDVYTEICKLKGSILYNNKYDFFDIVQANGYGDTTFMLIPFILDNINTVDDYCSTYFADDIVKAISDIDKIVGEVGNNTIKKLHLK